jgi:hypothetical protein
MKWLDEIEAQADETVPYYLPRLIKTIRDQASLLTAQAQEIETLKAALSEAGIVTDGGWLRWVFSPGKLEVSASGGTEASRLRDLLQQVRYLVHDIQRKRELAEAQLTLQAREIAQVKAQLAVLASQQGFHLTDKDYCPACGRNYPVEAGRASPAPQPEPVCLCDFTAPGDRFCPVHGMLVPPTEDDIKWATEVAARLAAPAVLCNRHPDCPMACWDDDCPLTAPAAKSE